jgi:hypothetical protein
MNRLVAAAVLMLACSQPAIAWDAQSHRLTADIAYSQLTPKTRAALDALISSYPVMAVENCPVANLQDASVWADCVRGKRIGKYAWLSPLHYDDIPLYGPADKAVYCQKGRCASEAILRSEAVLKNKNAQAEERLLALFQVVHFIGDIHQPMHACDNNDRGGNEIQIIWRGRTSTRLNLHSVWDSYLPANAFEGTGRRDIAVLAGRYQTEWYRGDASAWVMETHAMAVSFAYGRLPLKLQPNVPPAVPVEISEEYIASSASLVKEQLAKASVRIAQTINNTLAN